MFDRITFDPKIMGGRACMFEEILEDYPDLEARRDAVLSGGSIFVWSN